MKKYLIKLRDFLAHADDKFDRHRTLNIVNAQRLKYELPQNQMTFQTISDEIIIRHCLAQYSAQNTLRPRYRIIATEILALAYFPYVLAICMLNSLTHRRLDTKRQNLDLPLELNELMQVQGLKIVRQFSRKMRLRQTDIDIVKKLVRALWRYRCRYPIQIFVKSLKDLSHSRAVIEAEDPDIMLVSKEYSATISLIALQCRNENRYLFNIMHGDKSSSVYDSFFVVERCYCWDEFYADLFREQGAISQFITARPDWMVRSDGAVRTVSLNSLGVALPNMDIYGDIEEELAQLALQLHQIARAQLFRAIYIRPHPLQYDMKKLAPLMNIKGCTIVLPDHQDKQKFIAQCDVVIGFFSTMLLHAVYQEKEVFYFNCDKVKNLQEYHFAFRHQNAHVVDVADLQNKLTALKR